MSARALHALALLLLGGTAEAAGTVYRCEDGYGNRSYVSRRIPDQTCSAVAQAPAAPRTRGPQPAAPARATPASATAPAGATGPAPRAAGGTATGRVVFQTAAPGQTLAAAPGSSGASVTRGAIYRYERDGVPHYTNVPPPRGAGAALLFSYIETCFACGVQPGVNFGTISLNTSAFAAEIRAASQQYGVEEAIVRSIIHAESSYRVNALSHKGAQGLMQLMPATARRFGVTDAFDPAQNIRGGTQYLAFLLARYGQNLTLAAAAYNAGEGAVDRYGGVPPYAETQRYVQRVNQLVERYRGSSAAP
jgi:soluble lytic murein transglycosylase-like protein